MDILRALFRNTFVQHFVDFIMVDVTCVVSCHGIPPDAEIDDLKNHFAHESLKFMYWSWLY